MKLEQIMTIYGAGLSTLLAIFTLADRFRGPIPTLTCVLTGDEQEGNEITLANPTSTPLLIGGWELYWAKARGLQLFKMLSVASSFELGRAVFTLAAHGTRRLTFSEAEYFAWGRGFAKYGQLYLELQVIGRQRVVVLHVYDPANLNGVREPWSPRRLLPHRFRPPPRPEVGVKSMDDA